MPGERGGEGTRRRLAEAHLGLPALLEVVREHAPEDGASRAEDLLVGRYVSAVVGQGEGDLGQLAAVAQTVPVGAGRARRVAVVGVHARHEGHLPRLRRGRGRQRDRDRKSVV